MKKTLFSVLLSLPFAGLCFDVGEISTIVSARVYTWNDSFTSSNFVNYSMLQTPSDVVQLYLSVPFAVKFNNSSFGNITSPTLFYDYTTGNTKHSIDYQVRLTTTNSLTANFSPFVFPEIRSFATLANSLLRSGYRGKGIVLSPDSLRANIYYPDLVGELSVSTNNTWRSLVLSYLFQINSNISSIGSSVSSIDFSVGSISSLVSTIQNSIIVDPFQDDFVSAVRALQSTSALGTIDYDGVINDYNDLPSSEARALYARGFSRLFDSQRGAQGLLNGLVGNTLLDDVGRDFNSTVNKALTGSPSGAGSGGIAGDVKRLSTNDWASVVTNQLAQNTRDSKKQLKDNHDSITNQLAHMFDDTPNSAGRAIRQTADNTAISAARASDIASKLNGVLHVQVDNPNNIGVVLDGPVTIDSTQFNGVSVPLAGVKDKIDTWYDDWYSFWDISNSAVSWANFYNMLSDFKTLNHSDLSAITNSLRGVFSVTGDVSRIYDYLSGPQSNLLEVIASSITNNWDEYYFKRFRRANEFNDEDDQPFTLEGASETVFGRGFDEGEYSKLNWFSRVELLLFQLSAVSSVTDALESVDIEEGLNDTVDSFNQHGQDFVKASRRVVGVFQLIDGFAASMRTAFGSFSNPVTRGITLLPAGSWIGDNALVLKVSVTIQNALRLVFQCIWYLSAFVVAWRVVVATWSRVVSFVRWLWSVFDI